MLRNTADRQGERAKIRNPAHGKCIILHQEVKQPAPLYLWEVQQTAPESELFRTTLPEIHATMYDKM